MVAIRKGNLVKKTTFHGEMPEVKVAALILIHLPPVPQRQAFLAGISNEKRVGGEL